MTPNKEDIAKLAHSCHLLIQLRGYTLMYEDFNLVEDYQDLYNERMKENFALTENLSHFAALELLEKTASLQLVTRFLTDEKIEFPILIQSDHLNNVFEDAMDQLEDIIEKHNSKKNSQIN